MRSIFIVVAAVITLPLFSSPVEATTRLQVMVLKGQADANLAPIDGGTVCVGTSTNRASQGRRTTTTGLATNGLAVFENLADGSWIITAWRSGYSVQETSLVVNSSSGGFVQRSLRLLPGASTDPCASQPSSAPITEVRVSGTEMQIALTPTITSFAINYGMERMDTDSPVYLSTQFSGPATEYRVSETSDQFTDSYSTWRAYYPGPIRYPGPNRTFANLSGTKKVYLQLRAGTRVSAIVSDTITIVARQVVSAHDVIGVARSKNFTFSNSTELCQVQPGPLGTEIPPGSVAFAVEGGGIVQFTQTVCSFQLFGGRSLAAGWRFLSLDWGFLSCQRLLTPALPAAAITLQLQLRGQICRDVLKSVTLEGPAGLSWRNAFQ